MNFFTRKNTENSSGINVRRTILGCAVVFCAVSLWIVVVYPDQALDLLFYFAYMTIACTFIPLPTPQLAMGYGDRFGPALAAVLGGIGSCISGLIDYVLVNVAFRHEKIAPIKTTRTYRYIERLYNKSPFIALVIAAFTPIPFEPIKIVACANEYSRIKFVLAIFAGRAPRYFLLGVLQRDWLSIPNVYLYGSIFVLIEIGIIRRLLKMQKGRK